MDYRGSLQNLEGIEVVVMASSRAIISGTLSPATIVISATTGKITSISKTVLPESEFSGSSTLYKDYSPWILMPGLVDAHVHLNEPGRTEWEGFYTGTQAAAFGGVTTVIDMPLNSIPPTTTVPWLEEKVEAAKGQCWVDYGFYGGLVPNNAPELKPLVKNNVKGFKGFLIDSGVEEFPAVSSGDIKSAMEKLADEKTVLMFHAEMAQPEGSPGPGHGGCTASIEPPTSYSTFLSSRPPKLETTAVQEILSLSHVAPNLPLHIVHLSAVESIPLLREARGKGAKITAETCFHYLSLAAEDIHDGDTRYKCCPPIRGKANQDQLWDELLRHSSDGVIKTIVSDHSPCTPNLKLLPSHIPGSMGDGKSGDFMEAWGGISSVGLGLPILWTEIQRRYKSNLTPAGKPFLEEVAQWCCSNTAAQVSCDKTKGTLAVGYDGDVCVFDDEAEWVVEPSTMLFRNKCSPYQGKTMKGIVRETWLRGRKIFSRAEGFHGECSGVRC
ncbi:Allantoinase [Microsporum canis]|uniref:allantoinase n=1 Tax=Arthroderma otae (strain ATCC MYA-4605 / CBS 113480) TaxID=554155 RepID=C5FLJ2_ARTOC|nr:allantoinase [Microsporum canis CBS 113480]EEQ30564.1 allantoinase [Microsporum canis CBS 113480]